MALTDDMELRKYYPSMKAFRADEAEMESEGWTAASFNAYPHQGSWLRRTLRLSSPDEVDVHYLHRDATPLAGNPAPL